MNFATVGLTGLQGRINNFLNKTHPSECYLFPIALGTTATILIAGNVLKYFAEPQVTKLGIDEESRKDTAVVFVLIGAATSITALSLSATTRKVSFYSSLVFNTIGFVVQPNETKQNYLMNIMFYTIPLALSEAWMRKYA